MSSRRQISVKRENHLIITKTIPHIMRTHRDYPVIFNKSNSADDVISELTSLFITIYGDSELIRLISEARLVMMRRNNFDKPSDLPSLLKWVLAEYIK